MRHKINRKHFVSGCQLQQSVISKPGDFLDEQKGQRGELTKNAIGGTSWKESQSQKSTCKKGRCCENETVAEENKEKQN